MFLSAIGSCERLKVLTEGNVETKKMFFKSVHIMSKRWHTTKLDNNLECRIGKKFKSIAE